MIVTFGLFYLIIFGLLCKFKTMKQSKEKHPSRKKVCCGYKGCDFHGERRNLKRHMARKHKGLPIVLKNSSFGEGGRWQSWVQGKSLHD